MSRKVLVKALNAIIDNEPNLVENGFVPDQQYLDSLEKLGLISDNKITELGFFISNQFLFSDWVRQNPNNRYKKHLKDE